MSSSRHTTPDVLQWLYRLDSYTNAELGRARSVAGSQGTCVACDARATFRDVLGLCERCAARRRPDQGEIVLFRSRRRTKEADVGHGAP